VSKGLTQNSGSGVSFVAILVLSSAHLLAADDRVQRCQLLQNDIRQNERVLAHEKDRANASKVRERLFELRDQFHEQNCGELPLKQERKTPR
jgi:hypothetical protein